MQSTHVTEVTAQHWGPSVTCIRRDRQRLWEPSILRLCWDVLKCK